MRKILTFCAFVCAACCAFASGKSVAKVDDSMVFLQNDLIERAFVIGDGFYTRSFVSRTAGKEYATAESREFVVDIDGKTYDGRSFDFAGAEITPLKDGKRADVTLTGRDELKGVQIGLSYWIYDDSPAIRKRMEIRNGTGHELISLWHPGCSLCAEIRVILPMSRKHGTGQCRTGSVLWTKNMNIRNMPIGATFSTGRRCQDGTDAIVSILKNRVDCCFSTGTVL